MLTSNFKTEDMFVELCDNEAEAICGGKNVLKARKLSFEFNDLNVNTGDLKLSIGAGALVIDGLSITFD